MTSTDSQSDTTSSPDTSIEFGKFLADEKQSRRGPMSAVIAVSLVAHVAGIAALIGWELWKVPRLSVPDSDEQVIMVVHLNPRPPLPVPKRPDEPLPVVEKVKKLTVVSKVVEPLGGVHKDPDRAAGNELELYVEDADEATGVEGGGKDSLVGGLAGGGEGGGGIGAGMVGGSYRGFPDGASGEPPPPPPPQTYMVSQIAIEQRRISGNRVVVPDESIKELMRRNSVEQLAATVKMCLNTRGDVSSLKLLKSSGYKAYDRMIQDQMRRWRHRPYLVRGQPSKVCTQVQLLYRQTTTVHHQVL